MDFSIIQDHFLSRRAKPVCHDSQLSHRCTGGGQVLDSSELNLEAFQMLVDATDLDSAYLDMSHYTGRAMLDTLSREYDAVVVLDRRVASPSPPWARVYWRWW